ncbi:uncharacterized protein LOC143586721, partial [Bidens hawaiensis]|uniref:uncharacterized protein LOC143586721 n=1 Tax=Bidens hawaiensis TaxID=980011 RepID=UPI00404B2EBA
EHPGIGKSEKKRICRLMDCRKLSPDACKHAVQNERLHYGWRCRFCFLSSYEVAGVAAEAAMGVTASGGSRTNTEEECGSGPTVRKGREWMVLYVGRFNVPVDQQVLLFLLMLQSLISVYLVNHIGSKLGIGVPHLAINHKDLNYDNLASGLKQALENDKTVFDADRLQKYTGPELRELLKWPRPLPLEDERVRLLHEVGFELERSFGGKASNIVESCDKSAVKLVSMIARHFPGFRDHTVYKGHQVFLYKRAQIFAADVWGAFKGEGYGEFSDVGSITIFADYIAPAVLQQLGVFRYSSDLDNIIKGNKEIGSGTEEEVELRACSIYAVEKMRDLIQKRTGKQVLSVELDLWLWAYGVSNPSLQHHRTLSIYY